jgi:hypothetical protein
VTALNDDARMAAGVRAIRVYEASLRVHDEVGHGAPPPAEIADRPGRAERLLGLSVACPFCHATAGQPCHAFLAGRPVRSPHPSRLDAATATVPPVLPTGFPPVVPTAPPTKGV